MAYSISIEINQEALEPRYRHLHHAEIVKLLERARLSLLADAGFSEQRLISEGVLPVVRSVNLKFRSEVRSGIYQLSCDAVTVDRDLIFISQRISQDREVCVRGQVTSVFISAKTRRVIAPPPGFIDALARYGLEVGQ